MRRAVRPWGMGWDQDSRGQSAPPGKPGDGHGRTTAQPGDEPGTDPGAHRRGASKSPAGRPRRRRGARSAQRLERRPVGVLVEHPAYAAARGTVRPWSDAGAAGRPYARGVYVPGYVERMKRRWVANGLPDYPMWIAAVIDSAAVATGVVVIAQRAGGDEPLWGVVALVVLALLPWPLELLLQGRSWLLFAVMTSSATAALMLARPVDYDFAPFFLVLMVGHVTGCVGARRGSVVLAAGLAWSSAGVLGWPSRAPCPGRRPPSGRPAWWSPSTSAWCSGPSSSDWRRSPASTRCASARPCSRSASGSPARCTTWSHTP